MNVTDTSERDREAIIVWFLIDDSGYTADRS